MPKKNNQREHNSLSLMNEAIYLLRAGGTGSGVYYYLGTLPFILALLYFWNDMSSSGYGREALPVHCLILAASFIWMKTWQTIFTRRLYHLRLGLPTPHFSMTQFWQILSRQATIQPWGLVLLPLAMILMFPFGWVHAFFQNATTLDDGNPDTKVVADALKFAKLWPKQNHLIIWILSPLLMGFTLIICLGFAALMMHLAGDFGFFWAGLGSAAWIFLAIIIIIIGLWPCSPLAFTVAFNIGLVFFMIPILGNSLFGIQTVFLQAGVYGMANTTMLLAIYATTHLILDPILKAAYILRCFHGQSVTSGHDLLADLKGYSRKGVATLAIILALACIPGHSHAGAQLLDYEQGRSSQLNEAIDTTLQSPEYRWRIPKETIHTDSEQNLDWFFNFIRPVTDILGDWLATLGQGLADFFKWLTTLFDFKRETPEGFEIDWSKMAKNSAIILAIIASVLGIWYIYKYYKANKATATSVENDSPVVTPDLRSEDISANLLPENEWLAMAQKMVSENNLRLALRALYLAGLAYLDEQQIIRIKPSKSNKEYSREIIRFGHSFPKLPKLFEANVHLFERGWYGNYAVGQEELAAFTKNQKEIRRHFTP